METKACLIKYIIPNAKELRLPPNFEEVATADQIRSLIFNEFCDDLETRVKYKPIDLSDQEKYELIELVRGFRKTVIDLLKQQNRIAGMDVYRNLVATKLKVSGWLE